MILRSELCTHTVLTYNRQPDNACAAASESRAEPPLVERGHRIIPKVLSIHNALVTLDLMQCISLCPPR